MAAGQWTLLTLVRLSLLLVVTADVNVMKDVTLGFGQALELCREESQLSVDQMDQFFEFWREEFRFERRELGCALLCMSRHYNLLTDASRMHHENTHRFIQSFPNGEVLAQKMVSVIHSCEQQFNEEHDHCWRVLRVAECFKNTCQREGLAPSVELMMAELIMEAE